MGTMCVRGNGRDTMRQPHCLAARTGLSLAVMLGGVVAAQSAEPRLASHLENGRSIFTTGATAHGRLIENSHGMQGVGCVMCHGPDGGGGEMHGIPVPNITFSFLTDPRGYEHATGRKRPAYNGESIKAAIVAGIDAGGNRLHPEMPRWTGLTAKDLEDLIGYLRTLGQSAPTRPKESYGL